MSEINTNNPPPSGYGIPLFQWIVQNILFLKRRSNTVSGGGGGGSQNLQQVTDIGSTTTNEVHSINETDGDGFLSPIAIQWHYIDGSFGGYIAKHGSGNKAFLGFFNSTDFFFDLIPPDLDDNYMQYLQAANGIIALEETMTLQKVTDAGSTTTNTIIADSGGSKGILAPGEIISISDDETESVTITPTALAYSGAGGDTSILSNFDGTKTLFFPAKDGTVALLEDLTGFLTNPMLESLDMSTFSVINMADPVDSQDATTKSYVDGLALGLKWKDLARLATVVPLVPGNTVVLGTLVGVSTGILTIDGQATALGNRIVVKDEVDTSKNGLYSVTTAGAVGVAYVLTRTTDADTGSELTSAAVAVTEGTVNANKAFTQTTVNPTVGTDPIIWVQFLNNAYSPGTGIRISSNVLYAKLSEGVTGGQDAIGGTAADDTFTIKGSSSTSDRTTTAPAFIIKSMGSLGGSSGAQVFTSLPFTVNASGSAGYTGVKLSVTETAVGSGTKNLLELLAGASGTTSKFAVANTGTIFVAAGANHFSPGINTIADSNYTLVLTDNEKLIKVPFTTGRNFTIPPNSSVAFPTEARIDVGAYGAGQITFVAGAGVTIRSKGGALKSNGQYNIYSLTKIATDEWWIVGDLTS